MLNILTKIAGANASGYGYKTPDPDVTPPDLEKAIAAGYADHRADQGLYLTDKGMAFVAGAQANG